MKILTTQEIRAWDKYTIDHEPISSIELMERAANSFVEEFSAHYPPTKVTIVCGSGNNGGDGLAVARLLHDLHYKVTVFLFQMGDFSTDNLANQKRLPEGLAFRQMYEGDELDDLDGKGILIDALLGSGISRPVSGYWQQLVKKMNEYDHIVSIDIPSGLFAEPQSVTTAVQAELTISFQVPKWSFLFPEFEEFVGSWIVVDIGLEPDFPQVKDSQSRILTKNYVNSIIRARSKFGHKGTYGHALLLAGSLGKVGAAILSAKACLRSGVGLLSVEVPHCAYAIMQTAIPEAMVRPDRNEYYIADLPRDLDRFQAIGVGPGLDQQVKSSDMLHKLIESTDVPLVIDADGLNILAQHKDWLTSLPKDTVITPHPGEFDRLFGSHKTSYDRVDTAIEKAAELDICIVLKGAHTAIVHSKCGISINATGNEGMATAGSGDVLTGVLLSLLAQGYSPYEAAQLGVYWHGVAGDCAAKEQAAISMIASDIISCLGTAFDEIKIKSNA